MLAMLTRKLLRFHLRGKEIERRPKQKRSKLENRAYESNAAKKNEQCKGKRGRENDAKATRQRQRQTMQRQRQGGKGINPHHHGHRHQTTSTNVINLYSNNNQADEDGQNKIHNNIKTAHPKSNDIPKNEFGRGKRVRSR